MERLQHGSVSVELTRHCNLKCARCDHTSPWFADSFASFDGFVRDLDALSAVMAIDELRFTGGEALLHPELSRFLVTARERRYARGLVLLSNGVLVHKLDDEAWRAIDVLQVTVYPGIRIKLATDALYERGRRFETTVIIKNAPSFQQMLLNNPIEDPRLVAAIFRGCSASVNCHTVFEGRFFRCSRAHLLTERLALAGSPITAVPEDSVDLHGPGLRDELAGYLAAEQPLAACRYCLGDHGRTSPHVQLRRKQDIEAEQHARHDVRSLLDPAAELDPARIARPLPNTPGWWRHGADDAVWDELEAHEHHAEAAGD